MFVLISAAAVAAAAAFYAGDMGSVLDAFTREHERPE